MEPRLVQQKSAEDQVTTKIESQVMDEAVLIDSCRTKRAEQIEDKLDNMYSGNSIFSGAPHLLHTPKTTENKFEGVVSELSTTPQQIIITTGEQKPNGTA
ncbi:hypothetical protein AHF37_05773 [Paragonimus kellicotti]|nr:hypothetical protein AHF37_05773 [Paragonimus kellicotti]